MARKSEESIDRSGPHFVLSLLAVNISTYFVFYSVLEEDDGVIVREPGPSLSAKVAPRKYTL